MTASAPCGRSALPAVVLVFALLATACDRPPFDPPVGSDAGIVNAAVTLTFIVTDSKGTSRPGDDSPVPGAAVWLYDGDGRVGVFNDGVAGEDADGNASPDGTIAISVPVGSYGAMIKKIPVETQDLEVVAPVPAITVTPVAAPLMAPVAYTGDKKTPWTCATGGSVEFTTEQLPISATKDWSTTADIRACDFNPVTLNLAYLSGAIAAGDVLYGVISAAGFELLGLGSQNGFDRGILGFASPAGGDPLSATLVCPADGEFAVELFSSDNASGVNIVSTLLLPGGCDQPTQATLIPEAAKCALGRDPAEDAFFGAAEWGYGFQRGPQGGPAKLRDLTTAAVRIPVLADGSYSLSFRTTTSNGTLQASADFTCANGACATTSVKQTGQGNTQVLQLFFAPAPGGGVVVEAIMVNIPVHTELTWSINGSDGAKRPLTSRSDATAAYHPFRMVPTNTSGNPVDCTQDSNDGTWSVRGI